MIERKNRKIKVCLVAPIPPPYGGIANWTKMLLENTPDCIKFDVVNTAPQKRSMEGRTLFDRIVVSGLQSVKKRHELQKILKAEKMDAVHITTSGQFSIFRDIQMLREAKKQKVKSVYHIHFGRVTDIGERNTLEWKIMKRAFRLSTIIVAIDETTYKFLIAKGYTNVRYIPNPIVVPKEIFGIEKKQISFVGWCIRTKGIEELLNVWQSISDQDWKLNLIGPYNLKYLQELKQKYDFKNVNVYGELDHEVVMQKLRESSIFVLPSYTEGFPNAVLEAMILGKAIVATKVGAIPSMLSGECGRLIASQNVEELRSALMELMDDDGLREKYGKNAKEKAFREYTFSVVLKEYLRLWEKDV